MNTGRCRPATAGTIGLLLLGCMLTTGGCVRTSDGTVTVAKELDVGRYWRPHPPPPQTPPVRSGTQVFPVAPTAGWSKPVRRAHRVPVHAGAPARPLACRNEFPRGRRTRVVCK